MNATTILVSISTNGYVGSGDSRSPTMTPDGRFVAFVSAARNLVPKDTNGIPDVFVRDLMGGRTVLASVGAASRQWPTALTQTSEAPAITPDGRYVAFYSTATNLVPGVPPGGDIYVRDLTANTTVWASAYARVALGTNMVACFNHVISDDGQSVAYEASPTNTFSGTVLRYQVGTGQTDLVDSLFYARGP